MSPQGEWCPSRDRGAWMTGFRRSGFVANALLLMVLSITVVAFASTDDPDSAAPPTPAPGHSCAQTQMQKYLSGNWLQLFAGTPGDPGLYDSCLSLGNDWCGLRLRFSCTSPQNASELIVLDDVWPFCAPSLAPALGLCVNEVSQCSTEALAMSVFAMTTGDGAYAGGLQQAYGRTGFCTSASATSKCGNTSFAFASVECPRDSDMSKGWQADAKARAVMAFILIFVIFVVMSTCLPIYEHWRSHFVLRWEPPGGFSGRFDAEGVDGATPGEPSSGTLHHHNGARAILPAPAHPLYGYAPVDDRGFDAALFRSDGAGDTGLVSAVARRVEMWVMRALIAARVPSVVLRSCVWFDALSAIESIFGNSILLSDVGFVFARGGVAPRASARGGDGGGDSDTFQNNTGSRTTAPGRAAASPGSGSRTIAPYNGTTSGGGIIAEDEGHRPFGGMDEDTGRGGNHSNTAFFDGVRVISMLAVVLGHTLYFRSFLSGFINPSTVQSWLLSRWSVDAYALLLSIDTFLFISGFLTFHLYDRCSVKLAAAGAVRGRSSSWLGSTTRFSLGGFGAARSSDNLNACESDTDGIASPVLVRNQRQPQSYQHDRTFSTGGRSTADEEIWRPGQSALAGRSSVADALLAGDPRASAGAGQGRNGAGGVGGIAKGARASSFASLAAALGMSSSRSKPSALPLSLVLLGYLRRYLRLLPSAAMVLASGTFLLPYMASGPMAPVLQHPGSIVSTCSSQWWWQLLFLSTYSNTMVECMPWMWYLSVDMQLHLFAPVLAALVYRGTHFFYGAAVVLIIASGAAAAQQQVILDGERYYKVWFRASPFLFGMVCAVLSRSHVVRHRLESATTRAAMYIASFALMVSCIRVMWGLQLHTDTQPMSTADIVASHLLVFYGWGFAWLLLTLPWSTGHGGLLCRWLSNGVFAGASKLCFGCYLLHPLIIAICTVDTGRRQIFSSLVLWMYFAGFAVLGMIGSLALYLVVEAPFARVNDALTKSEG